MGKLGDQWVAFHVVMVVGCRPWYVARNNSWRYRRLVLCQVSLVSASPATISALTVFSPDAAPPPPMDTHRIHAALYRSAQPSLGSIALAGLLLTLTRILLLLTVFLRRVPVYLPIALRIYTGPLLYAAGYLEDAAGSLSKYALVYVGITGEGFWVSARRARALVTSAESGAGRFKKNFKSEGAFRVCLFLGIVAPDRAFFSPADSTEDRTTDPDAAVLADHVLVRRAYTRRSRSGA